MAATHILKGDSSIAAIHRNPSTPTRGKKMHKQIVQIVN